MQVEITVQETGGGIGCELTGVNLIALPIYLRLDQYFRWDADAAATATAAAATSAAQA